eukprot:COSAG06_NODE_45910_length_351_cov_0.623016_1_plen_66_part_01
MVLCSQAAAEVAVAWALEAGAGALVAHEARVAQAIGVRGSTMEKRRDVDGRPTRWVSAAALSKPND